MQSPSPNGEQSLTPGASCPPTPGNPSPTAGSPSPTESPTPAPSSTPANDRTVGLIFSSNESEEGYTLFAPQESTTTYLIDPEGNLVHSWESQYTPGQSAYLLEDGSLLRAGSLNSGNETIFGAAGVGGVVQRFDWEGNLLWEFIFENDEHILHHDIEPLPNGNVLMISHEYKSAEEAIQAGRDPAELEDGAIWPDFIIEVEPVPPTSGNIVWEWHIWDHLVQQQDPDKDNYGKVGENPSLIDINYKAERGEDWNHSNAIDYNPALDQILISIHVFNEIWIIDHGTTTEEAASHSGGRYGQGGDLMYRWGNPRAYMVGNANERVLYGQHDPNWIPSDYPGEGNILIFNNGIERQPEQYSSVEELVPPIGEKGGYPREASGTWGPEASSWIFTAPVPTDFYSHIISGAQRLPGGNTLICSGTHGIFFEVTPDGRTVWKYINPVTGEGPSSQGDSIPETDGGYGANAVFRAERYMPDYPGLAGRNLSAQGPIELYP